MSTQIYTNATGRELDINGGGAGQITIGSTGDSRSHENRQPFLAIPYVMCNSGVFPSRN